MTKTREGIYEEIENHNFYLEIRKLLITIFYQAFLNNQLLFKKALTDMAAIRLIRSH